MTDKNTAGLRKHCGVDPIIVEEYYNGTYKLVRIKCSKCCAQTGAKRFLKDAIREWENPLTVHLN